MSHRPLPAIVADHIRYGNAQILSGADNTGTQFELSFNVTENTWETVGPTGSGANNIWTPMDDFPENATAIIVAADLQGNMTGAGAGGIGLFMAQGGVTPGSGSYRDHHSCRLAGDFDSAGNMRAIHHREIPLEAGSQEFQVNWFSTFSSETIALYYRGFIVDA